MLPTCPDVPDLSQSQLFVCQKEVVNRGQIVARRVHCPKLWTHFGNNTDMRVRTSMSRVGDYPRELLPGFQYDSEIQ
jgi:hypothetical protein